MSMHMHMSISISISMHLSMRICLDGYDLRRDALA